MNETPSETINAKRETLNEPEPVQRLDLPPSTPILETIVALHLNADERTAVLALTHVRTLGDLVTVLERGEIDQPLANKIGDALGIVEIHSPELRMSARGMERSDSAWKAAKVKKALG